MSLKRSRLFPPLPRSSSCCAPEPELKSCGNTRGSVPEEDEEEEVEDFMSDSFLRLEAQPSDVGRFGARGGALLSSKPSKKRSKKTDSSDDNDSSESGRLKPLKQRMAQRREAALKTHIPESNIGHKLLSRMGYTAGMTLGRRAGGLAAPIPIQVKDDRKGLGQAYAERRALEQQVTALRQREKRSVTDFTQHSSAQFARRKVNKQLSQSKAACRTLDEGAGVSTNPLWSSAGVDNKQHADDVVYDPVQAALASSSDDEEVDSDSRRRAPAIAPEEVSHGVTDSEHSRPAEDSETPLLSFEEASTALAQTLQYMRKEYHFCFWCGVRYDDERDMQEQCPGEQEDDHE